MFRLGIIEESISDVSALEGYFYSERTESVSGDEYSLWHISEYCVPDEKMAETAEALTAVVKKTWYAHGFNEKELYVILCGKYFVLRRNAISTGAK